GIPNANAAELARRDFAQLTSGMTSRSASTKVPPFGLIACDDSADARRAAVHLVEAGVRGVIGFRGGIEAIDLASSLFIPSAVLRISAISTNPLITTVPHPSGTRRLVWRTSRNSLDTARVMSAFVHDAIEPPLRAAHGGLGLRRAMRVALVRPKNAAEA